jgi:hypothetical protein
MLRAALMCVLVRALWLCQADTPENNLDGEDKYSLSKPLVAILDHWMHQTCIDHLMLQWKGCTCLEVILP